MPTMLDHARARDASILWARDLIQCGDYCLLDTETTGIAPDSEIVQVGLLSGAGRVILDVLVKPTQPIPEQATAIHHITNQDVADALEFPDVLSAMYDVLQSREVVIYNAAYDTRLMQQSLDCHGLQVYAMPRMRVSCAMERYAAFQGNWNAQRGTYKWPKLPAGDHSAIGDCRATLKIIHEMAAAQTSGEIAAQSVLTASGSFVALGRGGEGV